MCSLILNGGCSKRVVLFSIILKEMRLVPLIYLNFITSLPFAKSRAIKTMSLPGSSILAFSGLATSASLILFGVKYSIFYFLLTLPMLLSQVTSIPVTGNLFFLWQRFHSVFSPSSWVLCYWEPDWFESRHVSVEGWLVLSGLLGWHVGKNHWSNSGTEFWISSPLLSISFEDLI